MKDSQPSNERQDAECGWCDDCVDAYVDGALAADERDRVERHLASCDVCSAVAKGLCGVKASLNGLPELRCPERVLEAVRSEALFFEVASRPVRERRVRSLAFGLAACLLVAVGAWSIRDAADQRQEGLRREQIENDLVELRATLRQQATALGREAFVHSVAKPTRTVVAALESSQLGRWSARAASYFRPTTHDGADAG